MEFWNFVGHLIGSFMNQSMKVAERRANNAERAYDSGKISIEQYGEVMDSSMKVAETYEKYQNLLDKINDEKS